MKVGGTCKLESIANSIGHSENSLGIFPPLLNGVLRAHLKMEDDFLYPAMMNHPDSAVREKATAFKAEMGGLAAAFGGFYDAWIKPHAISSRSGQFVSDWIGVRTALANRMDREDDDLYAPVDREVLLAS